MAGPRSERRWRGAQPRIPTRSRSRRGRQEAAGRRRYGLLQPVDVLWASWFDLPPEVWHLARWFDLPRRGSQRRPEWRRVETSGPETQSETTNQIVVGNPTDLCRLPLIWNRYGATVIGLFAVPEATMYAGIECRPQCWYVTEDMVGGHTYIAPEQHVRPQGHGRQGSIIAFDR